MGQSGRLQQSLRDFQPDYFSLSEKPPEEFCLSPNASTSSSSSSSSKSHISVDLTQKRGESCCGILPDSHSDLVLIGIREQVSEKSSIFFLFPACQVDNPFLFLRFGKSCEYGSRSDCGTLWHQPGPRCEGRTAQWICFMTTVINM